MSGDPTLRLLVQLCHAVDTALSVEELRREPELHHMLVEAERHCVDRLRARTFGDAVENFFQSEAGHRTAVEARRRALWNAYAEAAHDPAFPDGIPDGST